jgi:phosphoadenosine phosphosulfate reductase
MESEREKVARTPLAERVERAVALLRTNEPADGYYLAFSGGKDSCVIKKLAQLAGVRFDAWYNNTTIDPPELVRFIKREHPDVRWNNPPTGNMLHRIAVRPSTPPTRRGRWCCEEYKEGNGKGRVCVFGVRAEESPRRAHRWHEVSKSSTNDKAVCPVVYWTTEQLWEFIRAYAVPYCSLYDEGFKRLGCIGCPLAGNAGVERMFDRWPKYREAWKRAIIANWENRKDCLNKRTGEPVHQAKFKSGEDYWLWWLDAPGGDVFREDCQSGLLWTNEEAE